MSLFLCLSAAPLCVRVCAHSKAMEWKNSSNEKRSHLQPVGPGKGEGALNGLYECVCVFVCVFVCVGALPIRCLYKHQMLYA